MGLCSLVGASKMKEAISVLFLVGCVYGAEVRVDPLVLISGQGLVSGQRATDGDYSMFLGIPYALVDRDNPFGVSNTITFNNNLFLHCF